MRKILILALTLSILASVAIAGQPGTMIEPNTGNSMKQDKEKFSEKNNDVKVIITLKEEATDKNIKGLQEKIGGFKVGKKGWVNSYPNGFAATVKKNQLKALKEDSSVARIDIDEKKHILLETATYWSGTDKVMLSPPTGYGVTGDMDGKPYSYTPADIVIAVVDTGIDPMHKDLNGTDNGGTSKIIGWHDSVAGIGSPYDDHGHGTHVSSIAAGEGSANSRYKGVAPGAALVGVKVCDSGGSCYDSDMLDGINWIVTNKAKYGIEILTMSIGGYGSSDGTDPVSTALNFVVAKGIIVTVAAGNSGDQKYTISSPAAAKDVITVAAMADPGYRLRVLSAGIGPKSPIDITAPTGFMELADNGFYLAPFSSRGPTADNRIKPDISAPGVAITAAQGIYPNTVGMHGGYVTWSGTSMATPFVAGVAALIKDANYSLTPLQVKNIIRSSAEDYGETGCDIDYGCGRIRAMKALAMATGVVRMDQWVPTHVRNWAFFGDNDLLMKDYRTVIKNNDYPFASTLIMQDWSGGYGIDLDIGIYDPNSQLIAGSFGFSRQETSVVSPESLGTYNATIGRIVGSGWYALDRSYK